MIDFHSSDTHLFVKNVKVKFQDQNFLLKKAKIRNLAFRLFKDGYFCISPNEISFQYKDLRPEPTDAFNSELKQRNFYIPI